MRFKGVSAAPHANSGAFIVVELVDLQLLSSSDRTECFFELRWGGAMQPVRSSKQKPTNGICTFTERLVLPVPTLGSRRQSMELHLVSAFPTEMPLAWCAVPVTDLLAGRRLRQALHLRAPGSGDPTAFVLQAAFFYAEDSSMMLRPAEVPLSDSAGNALFANVRATGGGFGGFSDTGTMLGLGGGSTTSTAGAGATTTTSVSFSNSASAVAQALMASLQRPKVSVEVQTDLSGPVVSASAAPAGRSPSASIIGGGSGGGENWRSGSASVSSVGKMDEKVALDIRKGFDDFYETREQKSHQQSIASAMQYQQQVKDAIGDAPFSLRKPIDLLVMKRSVAAWPRDEVEGLVAYGEQMKRYADTLEKQNARLVIHQMNDAVAELRDLGNPAGRGASERQASTITRPAGSQSASSSLNFRQGAGDADERINEHREYSSTPRRDQQPQQPSPNRSMSTFSQQLFGYADDALPNVHNFEEVNGFYGPCVNRHSNRARSGNPEFVTRIEMNRGVPLDDNDRDHVLNHFGEL